MATVFEYRRNTTLLELTSDVQCLDRWSNYTVDNYSFLMKDKQTRNKWPMKLAMVTARF